MIDNPLNQEVRHIRRSKLAKLAVLIDADPTAWRKLLENFSDEKLIPDVVGRVEPLNLPPDSVYLIEQQFYCGKSPTLALLNHWAITGRRRPTLRTLLKYLDVCELKRAEEHVYKKILGIKPKDDKEIDSIYQFSNLSEIVESLDDKGAIYSFDFIYQSTNGFCHKPYDPYSDVGTKVGEGRFSSVFRAKTTRQNGEIEVVAAKLLKSECNAKYLANEINLARKVKHPNILELKGIALGKSNKEYVDCICLIYPYMENGSLLNCLSFGLPRKDGKHLTWETRLDIALKIARGISYLHSLSSGPIIHRDIKTANILIDQHLNPRVGDFTLVRHLDSTRGTETQISQNIIGTSVYMPPEAFRGDISTKFDTFSYGVVILELLTGLSPFNEDSDEDLFTYVSEKLSDIDEELAVSRDKIGEAEYAKSLEDAKDKFISDNLDKRAGDWNFDYAKFLFRIAIDATESRKRNRPEIVNLLPMLESTLATLDKQ